MQKMKLSFWGSLVLISILWLSGDLTLFQQTQFFPVRAALVQYSGIVAMCWMSLAMILALRPRWPEAWFGGLDKMYRLHKWLGIGALAAGIVHWLWAKGPKWAVGWGWLERPVRGPKPIPGNPVEQLFLEMKGVAESVGEWASYAAALLVLVALLSRIPYRAFFKTHRLLALAYLALLFHSVVLTRFTYWSGPVGVVMAPLLVLGGWAAIIVLMRRVGGGRQVRGTLVSLLHYPGVRVVAAEIDVPQGWPGHKSGQFAFVTSDRAEGAHPYTIASAWRDDERRIRFVIKELGDHTRGLRETLSIGQSVVVEGPYGCFTFDDACPSQIWIGAGIGITPFIARMEHIAQRKQASGGEAGLPRVHLFHTTSDHDEDAVGKLKADAEAAGIGLTILVGSRDGRLTGERIRAAVPDWRQSSIWFCGPTAFGQSLRQDFAGQGLDVKRRFHQELFAMR